MRKKKEPTVVDVLRRMRELLAQGWTRGYYARSKNGKAVGYDSPEAIRFCLIGAQMKAVDELHARWECENGVRGVVGQCVQREPGATSDVVAFNDAASRKKSEVIAVIDCAIKKATA